MRKNRPTIVEQGVMSNKDSFLNSKPRFGFLYLILILSITILIGRTFYLQILKGGSFRNMAEGNRVLALPITAPRGIIYDTNGIQLVENIASTDVLLDPGTLPSKENEASLIEELPKIIQVTPNEIREALNVARTRRRIVRIASALDHETVLRLEQEIFKLPGIKLMSSLVRKYPYNHVAAHIIGYTGPVSYSDLKNDSSLLSTDIIGKTGIERTYNKYVRGNHGVSYIEVDALGRPQKQLKKTSPEPGKDLELTIDIKLQEYIMNVLSDYDKERQDGDGKKITGAVVALDPRSGAIRALVSYPSYDTNAFSVPAQKDQSKNIIKDERQPLFNRAVKGTFPPGSTIKPLIAAAALEEGVISKNTTILSSGGIKIGQWNFPDWKAGGHGQTDVIKAISESVNTFFYLAGGGDESRNGLGVKKIEKYLKEFGWGKKTGIDLPVEASGFIPSPTWKKKVKGERWYIGDTYHLAIGQGDVLATPLQVSTAISAIANGGTVSQPFIVRLIKKEGEDSLLIKTNESSINIKKSNLETVRQGMRATIVSGSGRRLSSLSVPLAGKTGTAQIGGTDETHAWFTSFAPYESPQLVLTVLIERAGGGDKVAVPIAEKIWKWWIDNNYNQDKKALTE